MNSTPSLNFKDYTTWAGLFLAFGQIASVIPHPAAQAASPVLNALSGAVMTAFTFRPKV